MIARNGDFLEAVTVDGIPIVLGQRVALRLDLPEHFYDGIWQRGDTMTIRTIKIESQHEFVELNKVKSDDLSIGIRSDRINEALHDLGGIVEIGRGWWLRGDEFMSMVNFSTFDFSRGNYYIKDDLNYKGKNLKGKKCGIIFEFDNEHVVVSFDENIGGFSVDGMTKKGHCLVLKREMLEISKEDKNLKENRSDKMKKAEEGLVF
jgi:hypothetical protein